MRGFLLAIFQAVLRAIRERAWHQVLAGPLALGLLLCWHGAAVATPPPCEDGFLRFFYELYRQGSYCTCQVAHQEVVTENGRIRHEARYTLPNLPVQQFGSFLDLSQVRARLWGTIVEGPGGWYSGVIRVHEEGREVPGLVRQIQRLSQGQELEITTEADKGLLLRPNASYQVMVEGQNPALSPEQVLTLQGRACFYLVSR
jgi:hypothetical protein